MLAFVALATAGELSQLRAATPPAIIYSSYLGGREPDFAHAVAADSAGNIFVTGTTFSQNFPVTKGHQSQCLLGPRGGCQDIFVAKFDPSSTRLIYATYFGSRSNDKGNDITVDRDGNAIIVGSTGSDLITAKLDPNGRVLWIIGFTAPPWVAGRAVTTDTAGNVYITGNTSGRTFFTVNPLQASAGADSCHAVGGGSFPLEAIVIKLDPNGRIIFSTYLGGDGNDIGYDIAVDARGRVYVAGSTSSRNFPLVNPLQTVYGGGEPTATGACTGGDAFLTRIAADGRTIELSTYIGGSGSETARVLAVDAAGNMVVAGETGSGDFPVTAGGAQGLGGFVAKFHGSGRLAFASLVPRVTGLVTDIVGNLYTVGEDVRRLDPWGRTSDIFPAVGGSPATVALHPAGRLLVVGEVESGALAISQALQPRGGGFRDAFLTMYTLDTGRPIVVNAASYTGPGIAAGSLACFFGQNLAPEVVAANGLPLTRELAGTQLMVRDQDGRETAAPLIFVSPSQVNFVVPSGAIGDVELHVVRDGETLASVRTAIEPVAPGLFTASGTGHGLAAAIAVRISADGSQVSTPVARCPAGICEAMPIDRPSSTERVVLLLFGTGIRGSGGLETVDVTIGGHVANVLAVEGHSLFEGLDQVNVELLAEVVSGPMVSVVLAAGGRLANPVALQVR
jgi:uncharacterized protein (TIGR03437 family)